MEFKPRLLHADEIDVRVARVTEKAVMLLLYKDARCDQKILDETVGAMNWQRKHTRDNANCIVSIYDPDKNMWVEKEDTGSESNTEKEKGLASDSFKRSCVNWGIGRELYSSPNMFFPVADTKASGGKCYDRFIVTDIKYTGEREIASVTVKNESTGKAKTFSNNGKKPLTGEETENAEKLEIIDGKIDKAKINALRSTFKTEGIDENAVLALMKVEKISDLSLGQFQNIMNNLANVKERCGI